MGGTAGTYFIDLSSFTALLTGSAWADGKLAELAEQLGKIVEHPKSMSTQTQPGHPVVLQIEMNVTHNTGRIFGI